MTAYLQCKKCGRKFALSDGEYLSGDFDCPRCGVPHVDKYFIDILSKQNIANGVEKK